MSQMKELYEKVATSEDLKVRFSTIIQEAKEAGEEETSKKLIQFAKDQGFSITIPEFQDFFSKLEQQAKGELSDAELDLVAGGKGALRSESFELSIITLGLGCALVSIIGAAAYNDCNGQFYER